MTEGRGITPRPSVFFPCHNPDGELKPLGLDSLPLRVVLFGRIVLRPGFGAGSLTSHPPDEAKCNAPTTLSSFNHLSPQDSLKSALLVSVT